MAKAPIRRNEPALRWIRAAAFGFVTALALTTMSFMPSALAVGIGLAIGLTALFAPGIAVLGAIIAMSIPLLAANLLIGAAFLIIGFAAAQYLGQQDGRVFLLIALAFIGAGYGPVWAAPVIAGYLLGASEGAVAAVLACVALEAAGIALGHQQAGLIVFAGGTTPLVAFDAPPSNLLGFGWLGQATESVNAGALLSALTGAEGKPLLVAQPAVWALGAAVTGLVRKPVSDERRPLFGLLAAGAGIAALLVGTLLAMTLGPASPSYASVAMTAVTSLAAALAFIAVWEWIFPPIIRPRQPAVRPGSMSAEDADVDELLRLISTAEDQLASKHTTEAVIMITDMKSFSKMTEEDGSFTSAKTIQRHRDLLLPVINRYKGNGKSTGGDGLIAAFDTPDNALKAAAEMQRTLNTYNSEHDGERDIVIRCGIAAGEVVLDKGGRPFIGAALNLAARIMNLGDGGQILTSRGIVSASETGLSVHSHGLFILKNIAEPTEVIEILWSADQSPLEPQGTRAEGA